MAFSNRKKRTLTVVAISAALALSGGLAYAYWTSTGTGDGSATTSTSTAFTVTASPATGGPLTPGGPSQTVPFTVTNPGTGTQNLASVTAAVAKADGSAWDTVPGCSAADYTVGTPVVTYAAIAPGGSITGTVTITMINRAANQDACKLATVPLHLVAS